MTASALLAVAGLAACSPDSAGATPADEDGTTVVTVGTLKGQPHLYHPFLYADLAPEGVEFEVVQFDTSPDIKNAVVSGNIDFGVAGVPSAVSGSAAGQDVVVVAAAADGGSGIIGREGLDGIESLAGLTVGYPQGSSQEILLRLTLESAGLDADSDVELVNLPFSDMASALAAGRIDAFSSAELGPSTALQAGAVQVASPYDTPVGRVNIGLYTTGDLIEEDPDLVQQVVDTHIAATEQMAADPQAWADGVVAEFGIDQAVVETAIENIWPRWEIDAEYTEQVGALVEQMAALKQIDGEVDVEALLDTTFVDASTATS
ncbi:ABC transporter substrate-binding protein [Cellulomonas triticagri]|uniref:ABC transporter substrate-binding protein n=1 Tax=Cellulomonas triticagri TaxID=2483352 RepID=UPI001F24B017|nr:NrtA/SsuA/CpmA family ABC transporter substrate-binding protein [Cellulomonas triticagri]